MKLKSILFLLISGLLLTSLQGQKYLGSIAGDESDLYGQTKQVNQFFKRFNNEEDRFGKAYLPDNKNYRDNDFRITYMNMLFDNQSSLIATDLRNEFIETICNANHPFYLDFHGDDWFAELATNFQFNNVKETPILFLQLEAENKGYKWVITNVYFDKFLKHFNKGESAKVKKSFLHPMSHELDFMNIYKVFKDARYAEYYADKTFKPDYKTLFFYELKKGSLVYESVGNLKFHFFQMDGWYFEVSYFNRPGPNSGWLISKLYKISEKEKNELLQFYLP
ncbi:MAG: hypothetical protein K9G76_01730 [Bacteroidales bacterium]|nr:hypothetical protein [Bacteroidales bacterium]MCF8403274.1 hypothetical protein [Bacteroidales bacterium]